MMKCRNEHNLDEALTYAMTAADALDSEIFELLAQCHSNQKLVKSQHSQQEPSGGQHVE